MAAPVHPVPFPIGAQVEVIAEVAAFNIDAGTLGRVIGYRLDAETATAFVSVRIPDGVYGSLDFEFHEASVQVPA